MLENYKIILWDFDGVIMDSMPIRSNGFRMVLKGYPESQVNELMDFHRSNGGLSRYVKFRYFFEKIRNESISDEEVQELASSFSQIMLASLINRDLLIQDSVSFIESNWSKYEMHIVSGSDSKELNQICDDLDLSRFFKSIFGSPTPKIQLVESIIKHNNYSKNQIALIGDSINDYEAATTNGIDFIGYNNEDLMALHDKYISRFAK